MTELKDGSVYQVINTANHLLLAYSIDQDIPAGCWLTAESYADEHHEFRFKAISCRGDKWKFAVVGEPNLCVGFQGSISGGLQIIQDGGEGCHTEWLVNYDHRSGPSLARVCAKSDNGWVCWCIPNGGPPGAVVGLANPQGSLEQLWKFFAPVDN
ncbi:unnamed protein product [Rhizoctonia solani]|uniref:Uncharacterized protein n=1 Tax=Rhizoctonia solani TaxID=456999 RepID=A0A8H2XER3_9AGAM|nr:unnamed protein product [Rhizoctonia solani]CAE7063892.1 unnamed protein product [Rhizoctonia solani]